MSDNPFFSIVLPTLNRATYLPLAIQSALNQTFQDFELIISDNSSTDNTEQAVKNFTDGRIKYFKTDKILPMYESWEFALSQAKGEYITFLGDDDAHSIIYLELMKKIIDEYASEIVSCRMASYNYQNTDSYNSESLTTPLFSNKLFIYDSQDLIKDIYIDMKLCKGNPLNKLQIPQLLNTVYHKSVFSKIKNKMKRVFPQMLAGDFYLSVITLNCTEHYYYLDSPLSFHGISPNSTTSSITSLKKGETLKDTQPELSILKKVPLKTFVPYNFVADALMLAKSDLGEYLNYFDLDLAGYYINMYNNFYLLELCGHNVSEEKKDFFSSLKTQDAKVQEEVNKTISNIVNILKNKVRLRLQENVIYQVLNGLRRSRDYTTLVIKGKKIGFENIAECATIVEHKFLRRYGNNM